MFIVVMAILLGSYFLGVISPHLMVLLNARVAAGSIYQTIDRVSCILSAILELRSSQVPAPSDMLLY